MALVKCKECSKEISDQAQACPNCGAPVKKDSISITKELKKPIKAQDIFAALIVVVIGAWWVWPSSNVTPGMPVPGAAMPSLSAEPSDQETFEQIRTGKLNAYKKAPNEIQASGIFNQANAETDAWVRRAGPYINNWVGSISELRTSHGGTDVHVEITTANGVVYTIADDAVADSKIFKDLSNLQKGQRVFFSGTLTSVAGDGHRWESSLTEEGSLDEPAFNVDFTSIGVSPAQPVTTAVSVPAQAKTQN